MLEHRIAQLEERLLSARVITKKEISKDSVSVGATVKLRDIQAGKTVEYHIVGSSEANPAESKLSNESPVGKAIMGHKMGETVEVVAPRGALKFKILEIKRRAELGDASARPRVPSRARRPVIVVPWRSCGSVPDQYAEASSVLAAAFLDDPAWGWVLPSARRRAALLPWLFRADFEVTEADVWTTAGTISGCARWIAPGRPQRPPRADGACTGRDAAAGARGDRALPRLRPLGGGDAGGDGARAALVPRRHRRRPGAAAAGHRQRPARARNRGLGARRHPLRPAHQHRGERLASTSGTGSR